MPLPSEKNPGDSSIDSASWNELMRLNEQLQNMTVQPPITLDKTGIGFAFGFDQGILAAAIESSSKTLIKNVGSTEIPPRGLIEVTGFSDVLEGRLPFTTSSSLALVALTTIPVGGVGIIAESGIVDVNYTGSPPATGGTLGSQSGSSNATAVPGNLIYFTDRSAETSEGPAVAICLYDAVAAAAEGVAGGTFCKFVGLNSMPQIANFKPPQARTDFFEETAIADEVIKFRLEIKDSTFGVRSTGQGNLFNFVNMGAFAFHDEDNTWQRLSNTPASPVELTGSWRFNCGMQGSESMPIFNEPATDGGSNFIENSAASYTIDEFKGMTVFIRSGTGSGQRREVISNTSTLLGIRPNWITDPNGSSAFDVIDGRTDTKGNSLFVALVVFGLRGDDLAGVEARLKHISWTRGFYFDIEQEDGTGGFTTFYIGKNGEQFTSAVDDISNPLTNVLFRENPTTDVDSRSTSGTTTTLADTVEAFSPGEHDGKRLRIIGVLVGQTATGGDFETLFDTTQSWTDSEHDGRTLTLTGGTGSGQVKTITVTDDATDALIIFPETFSPIPDATTTYEIGNAIGEERLIIDTNPFGSILTVSPAFSGAIDSDTEYTVISGAVYNNTVPWGADIIGEVC